jgi:hypothetical protein
VFTFFCRGLMLNICARDAILCVKNDVASIIIIELIIENNVIARHMI